MPLAVAEVQTAGDATSATYTFTLAAGSAVGDLLVLIQGNDFTTLAGLLTPTGTAATTWTLRDSFDGGSNLSHIKTWTAPVTTSGAQTVIVNYSNIEEHGAILWRIPGAAFNVANHANGTTSTSHVAPSLTPAGTDDIYCCLWISNDGGGGVYNYTYPSAPFVGKAELDVQTFQTYGWGHEPITSGVATGTRTATASVTHPWCAAAILVKAAGPPVDPGPPPLTFYAPGLFRGPVSRPQPWRGVGDTPPPTIPLIRSSASAGNLTTTATTSTVTKPAGLTVGDYLLGFHFGDADNIAASMTAPAGFSALSTQAPNAGTNIPAAKIWGKVATAGDVAASNFVFNDDTAGDGCCILLAIVAGTYDPATPVVITAWTAQARVSSMVQTAPSAAGGVNNGVLLSVFGTDTNGTTEQYPASGPAGTTLVNQIQGPAGLYSMGGVYSETLTADGATGTRVVSPTPGGITTNGWVATTVVVKPGPPVGGPLVYSKTGGCGGSGAPGGAKVVTGAQITPAGSMSGVADTTAALTFPITTTAIGNAVLVGIRANSATATVTGLSGGGCTWSNLGRFGSAARGRCYEVWLGVVTSTVTGGTVTASWSADMSAKVLSYFPQEYTLGTAATWAQDGAAGTSETSSTTTTLPWPSVTAAGAGELYFGRGSVSAGTPTASGTPAGFVFTPSGDEWCYGLTTGAGAVAPTQTNSANSQFGGVAALVTATAGVVPVISTKTGTGAAGGGAGGPKVIEHAKTGTGVGAGAPGGTETMTRPRTGTAAGVGAPGGAKVVTSAAVVTKAGTAASAAAANGARTVEHRKTGTAAGVGAPGGTETCTRPRTGTAASAAAANGARVIEHRKTGTCAAVGAPGGTETMTRPRTGTAAAVGAPGGAKVVISAATIVKAGTGAAVGAPGGAKTVTPAATITKTGTAAGVGAPGGAKQVTSATTVTKTGTAAAAGAPGGAKVVQAAGAIVKSGTAASAAAANGARTVEHAKPGTAAAVGAPGGARTVAHTKAGTAASAAAANGARQVERPKAGTAASAAAANGAKVITSAATVTKAGTAAGAGAPGGAKVLQTSGGPILKAGTAAAVGAPGGAQSTGHALTVTKAGTAAAAAAANGAKTVTSATSVTKAGTAAAVGAPGGGKLVQGAGAILKSGTAAAAGVGAGVQAVAHALTSTKAGTAAAAAAANGVKTLAAATTTTHAGTAAAVGAPGGAKAVQGAGAILKAGTAAASGAPGGAKAVQHVKAGIAAATGAAGGTETTVRPRTGTAAAVGAPGGAKVVQASGGPVLKAGTAAAVGAPGGTKTVTSATAVTKAGTAAAVGVPGGAQSTGHAATIVKAGTAAAAGVGAGAKAVQAAGARVESGTAAAEAVASGTRTRTSARTGAGVAVGAPSGVQVVQARGAIIKTGGCAGRPVGDGRRSGSILNRAGTAAARGGAHGSESMTRPRTGLAVAQGAPGGLKVFAPHTVIVKTGSGVASAVAAGPRVMLLPRAGTAVAVGRPGGAGRVNPQRKTGTGVARAVASGDLVVHEFVQFGRVRGDALTAPAAGATAVRVPAAVGSPTQVPGAAGGASQTGTAAAVGQTVDVAHADWWDGVS